MKKLILFTFGALALSLNTFAQKSGRISGSLFDEKRQSMPFANVFLLKASDSTLVKGGIADVNGQFVIEPVSFNQYIVSVSMVGYAKYYSPKIAISDENPEVKLPDVQLALDSKTLGEVTVRSKKPLLEQQADKLVMNVENSIVSSGSTALEVLQRAPGVSIDQNDNISLKGKQGVQIYMDGKPTYMSQEQLANLLKNMNSDQIEKIEIISNPSSKYDAAGNSGIINIVTKRNMNFGTNGSFTLGTGVSIVPEDVVFKGLFPKYNANLNLNNRQGKFNSFGNISFRQGQNYNTNHFVRNLDGRTFDQYGLRTYQSNNLSIRAGTDYFINKKTTLGVLVNVNKGHWGTRDPAENRNTIIKGGEIESILETISNPARDWTNVTFNTNFKHSFNDKGQDLTADFDYSVYNNQMNELGMTTTFFDGQGELTGKPLTVTSDIPNKYNIIAGKVDYSLPLTASNAKFEFGAKTSFVKSDNDIKFYNDGAPDLGRTNHFIYTENINAAYTNFNKKFNDKWSLQTGLRLEHTNARGESITTKVTRPREYLNLFPSLYLTHTINKKNTMNFNYSRRIDRPDYQSLNPFIFFLDPYTYEIGNENLQPQFTDAFEVTHTYKSSFVTTIGYSKTHDFMTQIVKNAISEPEILAKLIANNPSAEIDPNKVTFAVRENIGTRENYNLGLSFPVNVAKWWNMNNNISTFYNIYKGEFLGQQLNAGNFAYNLFTTQNFILKKGWTAEASMWFNSANREGTFTGREMYAVNAGFSKTFWDKKASLKFTVNDIFATARWRGETNFGGVDMKLNNRWDGRQARVNFVYRFGNQNVKASRNRQTATSAEQRRVGGSEN